MIKYYLYNEEIKDLIELEDITVIEVFKKEGYEEVEIEFAEKILKKEESINKIIELKELLKETDWMIVANSELIQQNLEIKYKDIHKKRKEWRKQINILEEFINAEE